MKGCAEGQAEDPMLQEDRVRFTAVKEGDRSAFDDRRGVAGEKRVDPRRRGAPLRRAAAEMARVTPPPAEATAPSGISRLMPAPCTAGEATGGAPALVERHPGAVGHRDADRRREAAREQRHAPAVVERQTAAGVGKEHQAARQAEAALEHLGVAVALRRGVVEEHDALGDRHRARRPGEDRLARELLVEIEEAQPVHQDGDMAAGDRQALDLLDLADHLRGCGARSPGARRAGSGGRKRHALRPLARGDARRGRGSPAAPTRARAPAAPGRLSAARARAAPSGRTRAGYGRSPAARAGAPGARGRPRASSGSRSKASSLRA